MRTVHVLELAIVESCLFSIQFVYCIYSCFTVQKVSKTETKLQSG